MRRLEEVLVGVLYVDGEDSWSGDGGLVEAPTSSFSSAPSSFQAECNGKHQHDLT